MKKQEEIQLIEKGDKLYVIATGEGKRKAHEYFKDFKGLIKTKKSGIEIIREMRREAQMNTEHMIQNRLKQRV